MSPSTSSGKAYAQTRLVRFLQKRILELKPRKTQSAIAVQAGFRHPNVLAMIKSGSTKLPLDRVPALANALECDAGLLFQLALEQSGNETAERAIQKIFGAVLTENERTWIEEIRDASGHSDPALTARRRAALRGIFGQ